MDKAKKVVEKAAEKVEKTAEKVEKVDGEIARLKAGMNEMMELLKKMSALSPAPSPAPFKNFEAVFKNSIKRKMERAELLKNRAR